jgi:hypothetical protein
MARELLKVAMMDMSWIGPLRRVDKLECLRIVCALVVVTFAQGCISASGIPGGPLPRGGGFTINGASALPVGFAKVDIKESDSTPATSVRDATADHFPIPMIHRIGARFAPTSYFDFAADVALNEAGIEARIGLPERTDPFPFAVTGGYRRGWEPYMRTQYDPEFVYGRIEVYPLLASNADRDLYGVLTGGLSYGNRFHSVTLPSQFENPDSMIHIGSPQLEILRRETRVEATIGLTSHPVRSLPLGLFFMPYVVANRNPQILQLGGEGAGYGHQFVGYQQDFGFVVAVQVGYTYYFERN